MHDAGSPAGASRRFFSEFLLLLAFHPPKKKGAPGRGTPGKEIPNVIQQQLLVPISINIPVMLAALGYHEQFIYDHQDKFNYVLHKILEQRVFDSSITAEGYACLHRDTLRSVLGSRYTEHVLDTLVTLDIVQCDKKKMYGGYGSKSYGYRIRPDLVSKSVLCNVFKEETMGKKLRKLAYCYKQRHSKSAVWKNLHQLYIHDDAAYVFIDAKLNVSLNLLARYEDMTRMLLVPANRKQIIAAYTTLSEDFAAQEDELRANYCHASALDFFGSPLPPPYPLIPLHPVKKALSNTDNQHVTLEKYLRSLFENKYNSDRESIRMIAQRRFFVEQPDPTSRVFTNLSNLSSDLRQFLYLAGHNGEALMNMDIRNCQPYLLSLLLMDKYRGAAVPEKVAHYIKLTADGEFYEYMMGLMGIDVHTITKRSRGAFKEKFFGTIFFCKTYVSQRTREGKVFRQAFPEVAALIDAYKEGGHEQLAIAMQRREASFILHKIGTQLNQQRIWFGSIHDSLVVLKEHQEHVRTLILQAFMDEVGVVPHVKAEPLIPQMKASVATTEKGSREPEQGAWVSMSYSVDTCLKQEVFVSNEANHLVERTHSSFPRRPRKRLGERHSLRKARRLNERIKPTLIKPCNESANTNIKNVHPTC